MKNYGGYTAEGMGKSRLRYGFLDSFRGLVLISMILYHACWDLVYIFNMKWSWYLGAGAYIWQQSICWSFIFLSGFCWSLGRKPLKRGLLVFMAGLFVSVITVVFMPENRVIFGVLTLIGSCMLLMIPLEKVIKKVPAGWGLTVSMLFFICMRNMNKGFLGFEEWNLVRLPDALYRGRLMTFLGFMEPGFYSTDYFSLFPWLFLFLSGYFFYNILKEKQGFMEKYLTGKWEPLSFLGRHSLPIYMLHQPVIYGVFMIMEQQKLL